ncbi:MAG: hypothetical protein PHT19_08830 [Methylococcus sp.]|nr:hypothetical protein [Methylococcus sp.]
MSQKILSTVRQFSERHPAFTQGSLRALIFNEKQNGLHAAIIRVGRKVLIDEEAFFRWLDQQNGRAAA